jgi:hypothetical protein
MTVPANDAPVHAAALLAGSPDTALNELLKRLPGFTPEWSPAPDGDWEAARGAGAALAQIAARYLEVLGQRLGQSPAKRQIAFLSLAGVQLIRARSAVAPVAFQLQANAADARVPAGTKLTAAPSPGQPQPPAFETTATVGVSAARLVEVVSFWPGRDQYIDHSAAVTAGLPFTAFRMADLQNTPHVLYIGHDTLLALSGRTTLIVGIQLSRAGRPGLQLVWEYWDGQVWRTFKDQVAACAGLVVSKTDGTKGLTQSGPVVLATDFAEAASQTVNGVASHWIRARLDLPLPAQPSASGTGSAAFRPTASPCSSTTVTPSTTSDDSSRILPEIVAIDLSLQIDRSLPPLASASSAGTIPAEAVATSVGALASTSVSILTAAATLAAAVPAVLTIPAPVPDTSTAAPESPDPLLGKQVINKGLPLDKAFADRVTLDLSKTFSPFGPQPTPGSSFYLSLEEAMTKPGAVVTVEFQMTITPQHQAIENLPQDSPPTGTPAVGQMTSTRTPLQAGLVWEYWDGDQWSPLVVARTTEGTAPTTAGDWGYLFLPDYVSNRSAPPEPNRVTFTVPADAASTMVNNVAAHWFRVRLVSGGFGVLYTISVAGGVITTPAGPVTVTGMQTASVMTDPPALDDVRVGYVWQYGPYMPERVFTYNDFQYEDRTEQTQWEGNTFAPFRRTRDTTPALYLGFDQPLAAESTGVYFDIQEQPDDTQGPALVWEYWDGLAWQALSATDQTRSLRVPGLVTLLNEPGSVALARFGTPQHWLRVRQKDDAPPGAPTLNSITPHGVECMQRETIVTEPLGNSDGRPGLTLAFRRVPVLEGEVLEVREVAGPRAAVEWRLIGREVADGDERLIRDLERKLNVEGNQPDLTSGPIRLTRDRLKQVAEVWVRWNGKPHLLDSGPDDRDYVVLRAQGLVRFGDGVNGKVPPAGSVVQSARYQVGGGSFGNVPAGAINQVAGSIGGLQSVTNVRPAEGGADGETPEQARLRGPASLRHGGRALLPADYETLALEASPSIARAWALPNRDTLGRDAPRPGGVTLQILPRSAEDRPWPSFGLREEVRAYLAAVAPASLAAGDRLQVTGPTYHRIDVAATVAPVIATDAGPLLDRVKEALRQFLHPVTGGADGSGWRPGRDLFASDVATVLERVAGLDHVEELALLVGGVLQGDRVAVPAGRIIAAGTFNLRLAPAAPGATGGTS